MSGLATMLLNSLSHQKTSVQTFPRSIKLLLFSAGLISILFIFIGAVSPSSYDIVLSNLKKPWFCVKQLLSSPFFICIIINFMVILIAASYVMETNHFQENNDCVSTTSIYYHDYDLQLQSTLAPSILPPPLEQNSYQNRVSSPNTSPQPNGIHPNTTHNTMNNVGSHQICQDEIFNHLTEVEEIRKPQEPIESERIKIGENKSNGQRKSPENIQRKSGLEITKTVETDATMEATWRAITEGGAKTENKALKKRDTWAQPIFSQENTEEIDSEELLVSKSGHAASKELRKSMTFNETVSIRFRGGMMRGPSISLEELHGRVEAHIKNFNKEMRLQRQESEQRYQEMLNRNI